MNRSILFALLAASSLAASARITSYNVCYTKLLRTGYHIVYQASPADGRPLQVVKYRYGKPYVGADNKPQIIGRPIRPEIAKKVRCMLLGVTQKGGTGTRAAVDGYTVAGKTGTSQKPVRNNFV